MSKQGVFLWLAMVLTAIPAAAASLQNGDFSQGLAGWTTEGPVSSQGGGALLQEDTVNWTTTLKQQFTLPAGAQTLSFRYDLQSSPDGTQGQPFPDDFRASFLDPVSGKPLINTPSYDDYFFVDRSGYKDYGSKVSLSGDKVILDLTSLTLPRDAIIRFEEVGGYDGYATTIWVDDVQVGWNDDPPSNVPEPMTLLMLPLAAAAVRRYLRQRRS